MQYKFKNGAVVEGTTEQILEIAKSLNEKVNLSKLNEIPRGYYISEHSGLLKISDMNENHLRNALLKKARKYYETLGKKTRLSSKNFLKEYVLFGDDNVIIDLVEELENRD